MSNSYTKYLQYLLIAGFFATLIIPFIFSPSMFFPFITGKNFTFRILVELLFGLYVIIALKEPRWRPRYSPILAAVAAFVVWAGIALFFSVDPVKSFWGNFERMEGYITVLHLFMYFLVASAIFSLPRMSTWYFRASVAASVIMGGYGLMQLAGALAIDQSGTRLDGLLGNAAYLASYLLFNMFFALLLMQRDWKNVWLRWTYLAAFVLDGVILFFTETRGATIGVVGGLIVAAIYFLIAARGEAQFPQWRKIAWATVGVVAVLVIGFLALRNTSFVRNTPGLSRIASISANDTTTISRVYIAQMAWQGFKEKPITGWGQENFNFVFNKYYNPAMYADEQWFDRTHNAFLDWLIATGLPGFLLYVSFFALMLWVFARSNLTAPEKAILIGLLAAYGFNELTVFDNIASYMALFTLLAFAYALSQREMPRQVWYAKPLAENGVAVIAPIVAVVALGGAYFLNAPGIANATELIDALRSTSATGAQTTPQESLQHFENVLARSPLGRQEATEQLLQQTISAASSGASPDVQQQFYNAAHDAAVEMMKERPNDARLELFFGSFLNQFGQHQEALGYLQQALKDSPKKQAVLFEIGLNTYINENDFADALPYLKEAFDLAPGFDQARAYYAAGLYYAGQNAQADKLIVDGFGTLTPDNENVLQAYFNTKQYGRAEKIMEARVAKNPTDVQQYVRLAQIYYSAGDTPGAVAVLKTAEKAIPSYGGQLESMVSQLQAAK